MPRDGGLDEIQFIDVGCTLRRLNVVNAIASGPVVTRRGAYEYCNVLLFSRVSGSVYDVRMSSWVHALVGPLLLRFHPVLFTVSCCGAQWSRG